MAFSRQKSYVDPKRKDVSFSAGDMVFLKVSPMEGVMRFGRKGKLALDTLDHSRYDLKLERWLTD